MNRAPPDAHATPRRLCFSSTYAVFCVPVLQNERRSMAGGPTRLDGGEIGAGPVGDVQQVGALQVRQQAQAGVGAGGDARPPHPLAPLRQGEHAVALWQQPARAAQTQILYPTGNKQTKKSVAVLGTAFCDRVCR